ncbi:MAG: DUF4230 domain-containing protein [Oscillospiraceae bacterium]|nr:DUF4230 domain-containing protein [Oscillospiraceae bacterium]
MMENKNEIIEVLEKTDEIDFPQNDIYESKEKDEKRNDSLIVKLFAVVLLFVTVIFSINVYSNNKVELNNQKDIIDTQEKTIGELNKLIEDLKLRIDADDDIVIVETEEERMIKVTKQVEKALQNSSELTTIKHRYDAVGIFSDVKKIFKKIPLKFTETKIVYVYSGEVTAGIDLSEMKIDVVSELENKKIIITLPDVKVFDSDVEADSFEFPYVDISVLNPKDMKDYIKIVGDLEKEKKLQMEKDKDFMKSAEENCKQVIEGFFSAAGIEYEIEFK